MANYQTIFGKLSPNEIRVLAFYSFVDTRRTTPVAMNKWMQPLMDCHNILAKKLEKERIFIRLEYDWRLLTRSYVIAPEVLPHAMIFLINEHRKVVDDTIRTTERLAQNALQAGVRRWVKGKPESEKGFSSDKLDMTPFMARGEFESLLTRLEGDSFFNMIVNWIRLHIMTLQTTPLDRARRLIDTYYTERIRSPFTAQSLHCFADLYEYLAFGKMPRPYCENDMNHQTIVAIMSMCHKKEEKALPAVTKAYEICFGKEAKRHPEWNLPIRNYIHALCLANDESAEAKKTLNAMYGTKPISNTTSIGQLIEIMITNRAGKEQQINLASIASMSMNKDTGALGTLLFAKLGSPMAGKLVAGLKGGWLFLRHEARDFANLLTPEERELADKRYGTVTMISHLRLREQWETELDALLAQCNPSGDQDEKEERLAYFVANIKNGIVEVKLQNRLRNGQWGVGKQMSMRRFTERNAKCMTPADHRIADAYSREYPYAAGYLGIQHVLPHLIGDDRLFVGPKAPYTAMSVSEVTPIITFTRGADGFDISGNVPVDYFSRDCIITHRGASTISFARLTAEQEVFYRRIVSLEHLPLAAEDRLKELLESVKGIIDVNSDLLEGGTSMDTVEAATQLTLQVRPNGGAAYVAVAFVRPLGPAEGHLRLAPGSGEENVVDTRADGTRVLCHRDMKKERLALAALQEAAGMEDKEEDGLDNPANIDGETLLCLLEYAHSKPEEIVVEWPEGQKVRLLHRTPAMSGGSIVRNENGWFEIEGNMEFDQGQVVSMAQLIDLVSASRSAFVKLNDEEYLSLTDSLRKQLLRLATVAAHTQGKLRISPFAAALVEPDMTHGDITLEEDSELQAIRDRIKASSRLRPEVPSTLRATLRHYQLEGFQWMARLNSWGAGALLADDMGLGKTLQSITLLLSKASEGPALVLAPASVAPNWIGEIQKFAPTLRPVMLNYESDRTATIEAAAAGDVVVASYGMLLSIEEAITQKHWNTICLDEAHIIKNRGAKTSAVAMRLKGDNRIMLTGTPVQNHLGELWSLFQFLNPGLLGSYEDYMRRFVTPIQQHEDKERQRELDRLVKPFMLRRTKDKVAKELPEKTEIYQRVPLSHEEALVYEVMRQKAEMMLQAETGGNVSLQTLAQITRLRQCACDVRLVEEGRKTHAELQGAKLTALMELLGTIVEGLAKKRSGYTDGVLVFSQFTSYLALVREALDKAGIEHFYIDGSTDIKTRQALVERFQKGESPVFVISLKAGGLGLNLTRANYVVHMDPWWNPAIESQATDRAHRIGQKKAVTVYHLLAQGTIEEKIQRLHEQKISLSREILDGTDLSHTLTGEDLLQMLKQ